MSSLEIASFRMVLTSLVETSSPDLVVRDSLKKYFNKNHYDYKFDLKKEYEDCLLISSLTLMINDLSLEIKIH